MFESVSEARGPSARFNSADYVCVSLACFKLITEQNINEEIPELYIFPKRRGMFIIISVVKC